MGSGLPGGTRMKHIQGCSMMIACCSRGKSINCSLASPVRPGLPFESMEPQTCVGRSFRYRMISYDG